LLLPAHSCTHTKYSGNTSTVYCGLFRTKPPKETDYSVCRDGPRRNQTRSKTLACDVHACTCGQHCMFLSYIFLKVHSSTCSCLKTF
jgi:hypothetical protein